MKRITKINLPIALQITAILIIFLFGYPGCSSKTESKIKTGNSTLIVTKAIQVNNPA